MTNRNPQTNPEIKPQTKPELNPVILLHGIGDTTVLFDRLRRLLEEGGREVHAFNLVPNNGDACLEELAAQVASYIERTFPVDTVCDVIGFSMGGLIARYYVQRLARVGRVSRLITISAPHRGTWMAFIRGNTGVCQMRPGSKFLQDLNNHDRDDPRRGVWSHVAFTSIWSPLDLMIVPANSSMVPEAQSVRVSVAHHGLMMRSRRVLQTIARALQG